MKTINDQMPVSRHGEIAMLAVQLWLAEGRQSGRDLEYWLRAERIEGRLERELSLAGSVAGVDNEPCP